MYSVLYGRNCVVIQFRNKSIQLSEVFSYVSLSIEGRSIEIDKKIDIFDITSKIAAVSAAPIQSLTPVHGITRGKKPPLVLSKKVGICRASPRLSSFFVLSAARNFSPSFLDTVLNYEMGKLRFRELLSRRQKYIFETMRRYVLSFRSFDFSPPAEDI